MNLEKENTEFSPEQEEMNEFADIRRQAYKKNSLDAHKAITDFIKDLRESEPEIKLERYQLYHLIAGSTIADDKTSMEIDLPDGRFERFIRDELGSIGSKES